MVPGALGAGGGRHRHGHPRSDLGAARALLAEYRIRTGDPSGGEALVDGLLGDPHLEPWPRAFALFLRARLRVAQGRADEAGDAARAAAGAAAAAGLPALVALAWDAAGVAAAAAGDLDGQDAAVARARETCVGASLRAVRGLVALNHAACLGRLGRREEALDRLETAVVDVATLPFPHVRAVAEGNRALALLEAGRTAAALPRLEEALASARRIGDGASERHLAAHLGQAWLLAGDTGRAEPLLRAAADLADPGDAVGRVSDLRRLAGLAALEGRWDLAGARVQEALASEGAPPSARADAAAWAAAIEAGRGRPDRARARLAEAEAVLGPASPRVAAVRAVLDAGPSPAGADWEAPLLERIAGRMPARAEPGGSA